MEDVGGAEAFWHLIAMFWKVVGACVPPRKHWGGWAAFIVALLIVGIITTIVGEVATVLGCVINLKPSVTYHSRCHGHLTSRYFRLNDCCQIVPLC